MGRERAFIERAFAAASLVFRGLWGEEDHESMNLGQPSIHGIVPDMT